MININESIIIGILVIFIYIFYKLQKDNFIIIESEDTGVKFMVYNDENHQETSKMMAEIITRMFKLRNYLEKNKQEFGEYEEYITLLIENLRSNRTQVYENSPKSGLTSFSVNKGEELAFCLKSKSTNQIHDINLLMYVAIHEMAHIACPEIGHGPLFQKIFRFLATVAIEIGIYRYEDYSSNPVEYCGMILSSTIL